MRIAAIPETHATTWTCLFRNIEITKVSCRSSVMEHRLIVSAFPRAPIV
jgi:hypothetical protein